MFNKTFFSFVKEAKYFSSGMFQSYLVFIPAKKYIKHFSASTQIDLWKSNGVSEEHIENITKPDSNFAPTFVNHHVLPDINVNEHCLINNICIPKKVINIYISYTLTPQLEKLNTGFTKLNLDFTRLNDWLFGSVKLTKSLDAGKYKYSGYGIGFYSRSEFLFTDGSMGKNVIIFRANMSSSIHIDNKGKDILILGERPTQGLDDTTLIAEGTYPINFIQSNKRFVLSLYYNKNNSFFSLMLQKYINPKQKSSEIKDYALCLGSI